jgi:hypothetical protein
MKRIFICTLLIFSLTTSFAQKDTVRLRDMKNSAVITDRPPQAVYFQLGGSAPIFSVNYDRRFSKTVDGFGFSAGLGFWGESGASVFSIPASLNYLIGRRNNFLELAAGATFASARADLFSGTETGSLVFFHMNAGYRHQPTKGGFFFRGGISPLFAQGEYVTSFYLGFGYNF